MFDQVGKETCPPLFYAVQWVWGNVFGTGDISLRVIPALCGVATVPVAWAAARRLAGARAGLVAAALVAASPLLLHYSQENRPYSMLALFTALSLLYTVASLEDPSKRNLALWAVASALGLLTHYFAGFLVAPEAALLLWRATDRKPVVVAVAAVGAVGAALAPLAASQTGGTNWIGTQEFGDRVKDTAHQLVKGTVVDPRSGLGTLAFLLVGAALVCLVLSGRERRRAGGLAIGLGLAALVIPFVLAKAGVDALFYRNLIGALVPLIVGLAVGLGASRAGLAIAAALVLVWLAIWVSIERDENFQRDDWQQAAKVLGPVEGPRGLVLVPSTSRTPLGRYGHYGAQIGQPVRVTEIDVVGTYDPAILPPEPGLGGLRLAETIRRQKMVIARYRTDTPLTIKPGQLFPNGPPILLDTKTPSGGPPPVR